MIPDWLFPLGVGLGMLWGGWLGYGWGLDVATFRANRARDEKWDREHGL